MSRFNPFLLLAAPVLAAGAMFTLVLLGMLAVVTPVAVAVSLVPVVVVAAVVWRLLRRSRLWPTGGAGIRPLWALIWGAVGVMLLVLPAGMGWTDLTQFWGWEAVTYSFAGAWPEEVAKALGVVVMLQLGRGVWNRPGHGIVVGLLVGLGFELVENLTYAAIGALEHPTSDVLGVLEMWGVRAVAGPGVHALWTMLAGWGVGLALLAAGASVGRRLAWAAQGLGAAFLLHFLWNLQVPAGWPVAVQVVLLAVVYVVSVAAAMWVWRAGSRVS